MLRLTSRGGVMVALLTHTCIRMYVRTYARACVPRSAVAGQSNAERRTSGKGDEGRREEAKAGVEMRYKLLPSVSATSGLGATAPASRASRGQGATHTQPIPARLATGKRAAVSRPRPNEQKERERERKPAHQETTAPTHPSSLPQPLPRTAPAPRPRPRGGRTTRLTNPLAARDSSHHGTPSLAPPPPRVRNALATLQSPRPSR